MIKEKKFDAKAAGACIYMIVRYLYHEQGLRQVGIIKFIDDFVGEVWGDYNEADWYDKLLRYVRKAKTHPLVKIPGIPITKNELKTIRSAKNDRKEQLLFTMLVLAKYNNLYKGRDVNNDWIDFNDKQIFQQAKITGSSSVRNRMIFELKQSGYLTNSKKITNLNKKVNFIDEDSPVVLTITDMHDLGYQYLLYKGNKKIRKCRECGHYFKAKTTNTLYCNACKKKQQKDYKVIHCSVCDTPVYVPMKDNKTTMCATHAREHELELHRKRSAKYRSTRRSDVSI